MLANKPDGVNEALRRLRGSNEVSVDTETSGLDWRSNYIVGWVLTFGPQPEDTYYIPVRHAGGGNIEGGQSFTASSDVDWIQLPIEREIVAQLNRADMHQIFHNAPFDMAFMHPHGFWPEGTVEDTLVNCFLTNEIRPSLSLEACCRDYKVQAKKGAGLYRFLRDKHNAPDGPKSMGHFWKTNANESIVWQYAAGDGTSTWQLRDASVREIQHDDKNGRNLIKVYDVECKLIPILYKMRVKGIRIDEEALGLAIEQNNKNYEEALEKVGDVNVRSSKQMRKLFEDAGITNWPVTEKGNPSFSEEWLMKTELGQSIVAVRKCKTMESSFLLPVRDRHIYKGRVHPHAHQTRDENFGTKTGRLSMTEPNLGAVPGKRQGERGKFFRQIFIPDEGMDWYEGDYQTCEIVIAAHYSKAKIWVDGFKNGIDPHTAIANELGLKRQLAKTINLSLMTGVGRAALAAKLGLPLAEGGVIIDRYFEGLPEMKRLQETAAAVFRSRGYVTTLLGRRLRLDNQKFAYRAVNRLTQGGNADILKLKLVEGYEYMKDKTGDLLLSVYDSYGWQTDDPEVSRGLKKVLTDLQGEPINLSLPMKMDMGVGSTWGEATFSEPIE